MKNYYFIFLTMESFRNIKIIYINQIKNKKFLIKQSILLFILL